MLCAEGVSPISRSLIDGSATLTIDVSRKSRNATAQSRASTSLPRRVARNDELASGEAVIAEIERPTGTPDPSYTTLIDARVRM